MPDVRVVRPVPGTDFRPGDIIFEDDDGAVVLMREVTDREIEAVRCHPERIAVFRPSASWLGPVQPSGPQPRPALVVMR